MAGGGHASRRRLPRPWRATVNSSRLHTTASRPPVSMNTVVSSAWPTSWIGGLAKARSCCSGGWYGSRCDGGWDSKVLASVCRVSDSVHRALILYTKAQRIENYAITGAPTMYGGMPFDRSWTRLSAFARTIGFSAAIKVQARAADIMD